jgi:hypothetical protein
VPNEWWLKLKNYFLEVDTNGEKGGLVVDVGPNNNIAQPYNGEGGEKVLVVEVEHVDVELLMCQIHYDSKVEGDDQK